MPYSFRVLVLAGLFACAVRVQAALPQELDLLIDALFKPPEIQNVSLSPDGATIAYQTTFKGGLTLATVDATTLKRIGYIAGAPGQGIAGYRWADERWLVYYLAKWNIHYEDLIYANRTLTDRRQVYKQGFPAVVDATPFVKNDIIIREPQADRLHPDLLRVDFTKPFNASELAAKNPGDFVGWALDLAGVVRIGYRRREDGGSDLMHRAREGEPWQKLALPASASIVGFNPKGDMALVAYLENRNRMVVQAYDFNRGELVGPVIADPVYDVHAGLLRDRSTREIVGVFYNADRPKFIWFDPDYAGLQAHIRKTLPEQMHWFHGTTANGDLLVESWSDVQSNYYWLMDLKTLNGRTLKKSRPWLNPADLRPTEAVQFKARDAQVIHGYLTRPSAAPGPYPLLLKIHGGPYARDTWGFDPESHFFAALGYAVLQVNYRGSVGLGEDYQLKSILDVMRASVDDVADAARWAIDRGIADPQRVGIYGASYGGYIALGCATRYPDLFRCALGFAGVYDWEKQFSRDTSANGSFFDWKKERWGDAKQHPEKFRPFSPALQAAAVNCPVWLAHGGADARVFEEQTRIMATALKKAGKDVEMRLDTWGVHGFPDVEKRREHYRALAGFLEKHLPR